MPNLTIPDVTGMSVLDAAVTYAEHGWYVLPVRASSKKPGSIVGKGWPDKSSRNPDKVRDMFRRTNLAIALHMHTNAVAFDVDTPGSLPAWMRQELTGSGAPFQATRSGDPERGHYVFAADGVGYSNSVAGFAPGWGEVRGRNGIIIVEPSAHSKPEGTYRWIRRGVLPPVPPKLANRLRIAGQSYGLASADQVAEFFDTYSDTLNRSEEFINDRVRHFMRLTDLGTSRHEAMLKESMYAMREAKDGFYPAELAYDTLVEIYVDAVADRADAAEAMHEAHRMFHGAIARIIRDDKVMEDFAA